MNIDNLIDMALNARANAYAPYSKFKVGAAILLKNGKYILGCNIENASYGLSNCAERTALFKMISEGYTKDDVVAMCIVGQTNVPISPCGACRQVMKELLSEDTPIYLTNLSRNIKKCSVVDLLPYSFSKGDLE
ncbi:MAG: cytidine deaminase [Anaeroplasma sp.]